MIDVIAYKPLDVADSLAVVAELAEQSYRAEIPGFQVSEVLAKKVGLVPVMESIEAGSEIVLGRVIPFTTRPPLYNEPGAYAPHTDGGFRGLSLHHNESGLGIVQLAHLMDSTQPKGQGPQVFMGPEDSSRSYGGGGIETVDVEHGPIFQGTIEPGKFTVFSQGNIDGLPSAIHFFKRSGGGNWWTRYSSSYSDAELIPAVLDEHAQHFKLGLIQSEYRKIHDDKRTLEYYANEGKTIPEEEKLRSRFDPDELDTQLKIHPGRNIESMGFDFDAGIIRYKTLTHFGQAKRFIGSAFRRK